MKTNCVHRGIARGCYFERCLACGAWHLRGSSHWHSRDEEMPTVPLPRVVKLLTFTVQQFVAETWEEYTQIEWALVEAK